MKKSKIKKNGGKSEQNLPEVNITGNRPTYRDSLDAYNTALDVYSKIGKSFDDDYNYKGKDSRYSPFMEGLARGEKPLLKGNDRFYGVTKQPLKDFNLNDDIKFWDEVVKYNPDKKRYQEISEQMHRLEGLKVKPYAASHASELPTAYLYKKPTGEQPIQLDRKEFGYEDRFKPTNTVCNEPYGCLPESSTQEERLKHFKALNSEYQPTKMDFNSIPYKKDSYFTRPKQSQEIGNLEYFDKKTGKKLENGGKINNMKKKLRIKKAVNGYNTDGSIDLEQSPIEYNFSEDSYLNTLPNLTGTNGKIAQMLGQNQSLKQLPQGSDSIFNQPSQFSQPFRENRELSYTYGNKPKQTPPKFDFNINSFGGNKYFEKANMYRNNAINSFSQIGKNNQQPPQNQTLIGSKFGGLIKGEFGGELQNPYIHAPELGGYFKKK